MENSFRDLCNSWTLASDITGYVQRAQGARRIWVFRIVAARSDACWNLFPNDGSMGYFGWSRDAEILRIGCRMKASKLGWAGTFCFGVMTCHLLGAEAPDYLNDAAPTWSPETADAFMAINDPDRFAWKLFCAISQPTENANPGDVLWETWPEQEDIYRDPYCAPVWSKAEFPGKVLRESSQQSIRAHESGVPTPRDGVENEEVRDNKAAFDYIVENELWYIRKASRRK